MTVFDITERERGQFVKLDAFDSSRGPRRYVKIDQLEIFEGAVPLEEI